MQIEKHKHVTLEYTLKTPEGELIDSSDTSQPLSYVHGTESIIHGLEKALDGKAVGDRIQVTLPPDDAYGPHEDSRVHEVPRHLIGDGTDVQVGMLVTVSGPRGEFPTLVVKVEDESVTLDANHPLAGKTLDFDVKVLEVRDAAAGELPQAQPPAGQAE